MDIYTGLFTAVPALAFLALLFHLVRTQREVHKDKQDLLQNRLAIAEKDLNEARAALKYVSAGNSAAIDAHAPKNHSVGEGAPSKKRLFISTPIRAFDDRDLEEFVDGVSRMIDGMNASRRFGEIWYENYKVPKKEQFEATRMSIKDYFTKLEQADVFVAIIPMPSLSSVYFEAGYAVALNKPCHFFTPETAGKVMPTLMGEAHRLKRNVSTVRFDSLNHIQRVLTEDFGG